MNLGFDTSVLHSFGSKYSLQSTMVYVLSQVDANQGAEKSQKCKDKMERQFKNH